MADIMSPPVPQPSRRSFWQRVTDGLALEELWSQFRTEARVGYGLYSREVDWEAIGREPGWKRPFYVTKAFFWAMLMKLSPARRILLLAAIIFVLFGRTTFRLSETQLDLNLLGLGIIILFFLLALELADRVTMKRDLEIAREIQHWLVPDKPPQVPGVDIAFATRPANTVAGDYYDAFFRPAPLTQTLGRPPATDGRDRLLVVVADVAGKSVPAALLMATFQASLHALAVASGDLLGLVDGLNRYSCAHSLGGLRFTTAFLGEYDPATRHLRYVNAGHNPPILRRPSGDVVRLTEGGLPLGIEPAARYDSAEVTLAPHDTLLIFTDGTVEAVNHKGEEYTETGLLHLLTVVPGESAAETIRHLFEDLDRFVGAAPQRDDITCLVLRAV